ncbi:hypothetical protein [Bosea sp. UNC402CLCol]|uniref:hypothetical protein n=1 Tax=Bosea sp. UNC402CLCol TaxID=1510531 RepID=UPI00056FB804|nr:hypothetical protein [Bosea sp. UNC402CLCol]
MRLALAIITLALTGCNSTPQSDHPARDLTVGTAQCSKFKWGTSEMAQCLDNAARSQSATSRTGRTDNSG